MVLGVLSGTASGKYLVWFKSKAKSTRLIRPGDKIKVRLPVRKHKSSTRLSKETAGYCPEIVRYLARMSTI